MTRDDPDSMQPLDPDHEGEQGATRPAQEEDDVGLPIDPADPLKRDQHDDEDELQPGLDPTPPVISPD